MGWEVTPARRNHMKQIFFFLILTVCAIGADNELSGPRLQDAATRNQLKLSSRDNGDGTHTPRVVAEVSAVPESLGTVTPSITTANIGGTIAAGSRAVLFSFSADFTGTIQGGAFTGASNSFRLAAPTGTKFSAISYTVTAGTIQIVDVR